MFPAEQVQRQPRVPGGASADSARVSVAHDWVTITAASWLTVGLFVDGYAHDNILDTATEDFFTPYHGLFYSGYLVVIGWFAWLSVKVTAQGTGVGPEGYRLGIAGAVVFGVGGIADLLWHQAYGIEDGLDALFSPSHLLLMVGLLLISTTPVRSARSRGTGWKMLGPAVVGQALATAIAAFFTAHIWGLAKFYPARTAYSPSTAEGELQVIVLTGSMFTTTVVLTAAATMLHRDFELPRGAFTLLYALPNVLVVGAFGANLLGIVPALVGGVILDGLLHHRRTSGTTDIAVGFGVATLLLWLSYFGLVASSGEFRWPVERWLGASLFSALVSALLATQLSRGIFGQRSSPLGQIARVERRT